MTTTQCFWIRRPATNSNPMTSMIRTVATRFTRRSHISLGRNCFSLMTGAGLRNHPNTTWSPSSLSSAASKLTSHPHDDDDDDHLHQHPFRWRRDQLHKNNHRLYHTSARREILPLIGVAVVLVIGRYSFKALNRMDDEWNDYQWQLQQYEKRQGLIRNKGKKDKASGAVDNDDDTDDEEETIAIDLGSTFIKLAASSAMDQDNNASTDNNKSQVIVSREGNRSVFAGILYDNTDSTLVAKRGPGALEQFFYAPSSSSSAESTLKDDPTVTLPFLSWILLSSGGKNDNLTQTLRDTLQPLLDESLQRLDYGRARQVVTVPVQTLLLPSTDYGASIVQALEPEQLNNADEDDAPPPTTVLPDAVATVWGAQQEELLPLDNDQHSHTTLVVDVGGLVTQCSIVHRDVVVASVAIPLGGETLVELVQEHVRLEAFGNDKYNDNNRQDESSFLADARSLAALQVQARAATLQFTTTTTATSNTTVNQQVVPIHVPYLFANPENHHLDTTLSTSVLKSLLDEHIQQQHAADTETLPYLSRHLPPPTDVTSLLTSSLTQLLEQGQRLPSSMDHILITGGACRSGLFWNSLRQSLEQVALISAGGGDDGGRLVLPSSASLATELTVLGATTMLPNYDYDMARGLQRR